LMASWSIFCGISGRSRIEEFSIMFLYNLFNLPFSSKKTSICSSRRLEIMVQKLGQIVSGSFEVVRAVIWLFSFHLVGFGGGHSVLFLLVVSSLFLSFFVWYFFLLSSKFITQQFSCWVFEKIRTVVILGSPTTVQNLYNL
jgi:hypothetical protein